MMIGYLGEEYKYMYLYGIRIQVYGAGKQQPSEFV